MLGRCLACGVLAVATGSGCVGAPVPDPRVAAARYADAAARGDASALYALMSDDAQKARSLGDLQPIVSGERAELADRARALAAKDVSVHASAVLAFDDGEEASLSLEEGHFRVASGGTVPGGAATPEGALDDLRRVLARRSYAGLLRVLTPATRSAMEADLRALVSGLERPRALDVQVHGDSATVHVAEGHRVRLKRDPGGWRVDDFE